MVTLSEAEVESQLEELAEKPPLSKRLVEFCYRQPLGATGALVVLVMIFMAVFAPYLTRFDPVVSILIHAQPYLRSTTRGCAARFSISLYDPSNTHT